MLGHFTYIVLEVVWALPVLILQWVAGGRTLRKKCGILLAAIVLPTVYLSMADGFAINHGIWALHRDRNLGAYLGPVPVEEVLFFVLTNAMVAQSMVLIEDWWSRRRTALNHVE